MDYESTALTAELRAPLVNLAQCLYGADTLVRRFDVEFFGLLGGGRIATNRAEGLFISRLGSFYKRQG